VQNWDSGPGLGPKRLLDVSIAPAAPAAVTALHGSSVNNLSIGASSELLVTSGAAFAAAGHITNEGTRVIDANAHVTAVSLDQSGGLLTIDGRSMRKAAPSRSFAVR
jgi:hypothetical protein